MRGFLKIGEVVARSGLTERAIRHYEDCGLVLPERSAAGQRLYDLDCLERLAAIQILRRASFSLAEIGALLETRVEPLVLIRAQIESLEATLSSTHASLALLRGIESELGQGKTADADMLCRIVRAGEECAPDPSWRGVFDRYFTPDRQQSWAALQDRLRARVDPVAYNASWRELGADIKAALPIDPASPAAQAFLARWDELLAPFRAVADSRQQAEARDFWSNVGDWGGAVDQPINQAVVDFIKAARRAQEKRGTS